MARSSVLPKVPLIMAVETYFKSICLANGFEDGPTMLACNPLACNPLACNPLACNPLACNPRRTRQDILEIATTFFAKQGSDVLIVRLQVGPASASNGQLLFFFGSIEVLYLEVIKSVYGRVS